jgi:hypothetical protein
LGLSNPLLRAHSRLHKGYALKRIAQELAAQGDSLGAWWYAREALGVLPTLKWVGYTMVCGLRRVLRR